MKWIALYLRLRRIYIKGDPQRLTYVDVAMRTSEDTGTLGLFGTDAAKAYISQQRRLQDIRNGEAAAIGTPAQS